MNKKRLLAAATCAAAVTVAAAGAAFAGGTGPPGKGNVTPKDMSHPNSICSFSGLNDFAEGPEDFIAQASGST